MARKIKDITLCEFGGCKSKATTLAHKLWGKGGTIRTCDEHKPGSHPSAQIKVTREWYRLEPISR